MSESPLGPVPTQLAHFEIKGRIGFGGMAEVFLADKHGAENTCKRLVVKRILPVYGNNSDFREMFKAEAGVATRLNHPNIVQVYEFQEFAEAGQLLSMEYVEGLDLGKLMAYARIKSTRIPPWVAAYIIAEAAKGLHYAHERKSDDGVALAIVHRDVSPQNILLSYEGAVKIADFGVATANLFRDKVGVLKGKYGYMSPEQARAEIVDRRTDIYALGVIFYEMLAGRPLRPGLSGDDLLAAVRSGQIVAPSTYVRDIPTELEAIVLRALSARKEERYQTARDMAGAISRAMMQRQQLVEAVTLEGTIEALAPRNITSPDVDRKLAFRQSGGLGDLAAQNTVAAVRSARDGSGISSVGTHDEPDIEAKKTAPNKVTKEVRHVAILTLRLHGLEELRQLGGAERGIEREIRNMLDSLAFKWGARLTWTSHDHARAIVGLLANPSRATSDAANCAIDIQEFLKASAEEWPVTVQASIGIVRGIASGVRDHQGHLIDHALQNPAEFLASLVGDRAPAGCTWAAGGIYRLVRDEFVWRDALPLHIEDAAARQAPSTMRIHELIRRFSRGERAIRREASPSDLIGRDAEKADLHSALHNATQPAEAGAEHVVVRVVVGEMGIGKSALVRAFLNEVRSDVSRIHLDPSPANSELAFGAVAELVRALSSTSSDMKLEQAQAVLNDLLGMPGGAITYRLAQLVSGEREEHGEDEDAAYVRKIVVSGLRRLLAVHTQVGASIWIIDGLQWVDRPSLEIFSELMRESGPHPLLVLLVTRPEERVLPFIENLVRIELRGLRFDEMAQLVESRFGVQQGVASACADLIPRVAGNPFFLLEMVDALLEQETLEIKDHDGRQIMVRAKQSANRAQALPSTLEQLIANRLNELPPEERAVVSWLSAAGGPLSESDIVNLGRLTSPEPIGRLCARGMCDRRGDSIDFRHPIARDVAYQAIDAKERVLLHRRLGEHLAETPIASGLSAVIVARHLARGKLFSRAADYYLEAAQAARAGYQTQLARPYFQRALLLLDTSDLRRLRAHEALEGIYRLLGRHKQRRRHLHALRQMARGSNSAEWVALALLRTAVFYYDENFYSSCETVARQACEAARVASAPYIEVEALSTQGEALRELGDVQGALAACDRALKLAKNKGVSPRIRADVLRSRGLLLRRVGRVREAVDCHVEAIAVFRRVGARRPEARTMNALAFAMFVLERFEDSIALALSSISIDLAIGGRFQIAKTLSNIGQAYARLGDLARGIAYLKRAREAHEHYGDQDSRADTLIVSAEVMLEAGDLDAARSFCLDAAALTSVTGSAYDEVHEKIVHAMLDRMSNDSARAVTLAASARQAAESQALVSFSCLATAVEAAARVCPASSSMNWT